MDLVQPIRDRKQINNIKNFLKARSGRDFLLFTLGINSGLRISDLLNLSVEDVKGKERISLREKKTGKLNDFPLSENCKKAIADYLKKTGLTEGPLFPGRDGGPLSRIQAWRILSEAAKQVGIKEPIGPHSLRKSYGYHIYKSGVDITRIQAILNHSSPGITLRYIGITKDEIDNIRISVDL